MRETLDAILSFIGAESLTDEEFEAIEALDIDMSEPNEVYNALAVTLQERESMTDMVQRLEYYYLAQGITVTLTSEPEGVESSPSVSNIMVGGVL